MIKHFVCHSIAALFLFPGLSFSANTTQEIHGFHFASCDSTHCIEAWSDLGYLSQIDFGFTTVGRTRLKISSIDQKSVQDLSGTDCSYRPRLAVISLQHLGGATTIVSLNDLLVQTFPGEARAEKKR